MVVFWRATRQALRGLSFWRWNREVVARRRWARLTVEQRLRGLVLVCVCSSLPSCLHTHAHTIRMLSVLVAGRGGVARQGSARGRCSGGLRWRSWMVSAVCGCLFLVRRQMQRERGAQGLETWKRRRREGEGGEGRYLLGKGLEGERVSWTRTRLKMEWDNGRVTQTRSPPREKGGIQT